MNYFVHVTDKADQDLGESFDYIDLTLKNPLAADVLVDTAEKKLAQLSTFPKRYPVVRDPFLASLGIRFVPVQNCLIEPSPRSFGDFLFSLQFNEVFALVKHFFGA